MRRLLISSMPGLVAAGLLISAALQAASSSQTFEPPAAVIQDKIRGGLIGQILGDLNGLKHKIKYIAEKPFA